MTRHRRHPPRRSGPAPDAVRRERLAEGLRCSMAEDRTWTSRQLSEALAGRGIEIAPRQVRHHPKSMKAGYRRTASTLKHKQDDAEAERADKVLANLKAKAHAGSIVLYYRLLADAAGGLQLEPAGAAEIHPM